MASSRNGRDNDTEKVSSQHQEGCTQTFLHFTAGQEFTENNFTTHTKELTLILENFNVVLVGQSTRVVRKLNPCSCRCAEKESELLDVREAQFESKPTNVGNTYQGTVEDTDNTHNKEEFCNDMQHRSNNGRQCVPLKPATKADIDLSVPLIIKKGFLNGKQCERVMEKLEHLQDNGKFEKHELLVKSYLQLCVQRGNADMQLALQLEQGVAYTYHREFKKSKRIFASVIKFEDNSDLKNANILFARAYFLLAADLRNRKVKKIPMILECLHRSEIYLQNHDSPEDWAELYYNYGSAWLTYLSLMSTAERNAQARRDACEKARSYFEMAIEACKRDSRVRVQAKHTLYSHLKVAALLLDCSSNAARCQQKRIPPKDIDEAKQHLDFITDELGPIPSGTRVQLLKTRSDQFYRQGWYELAKDKANEALSIALQHEFNTELDILQERISFLESLREKRIHEAPHGRASTRDSGTDPLREPSSSDNK